jgi:hypothetical protein
MPTTLPVRIGVPFASDKTLEGDGSLVVIFLVTSIGILLSLVAAMVSPDWLIGM